MAVDKKEYWREYAKKNKERLQELRNLNREKLRAYSKEYVEKNKEKIREYRKNYYQENKQKILNRMNAYNNDHKEERHSYDKQYYRLHHPKNNVFKIETNVTVTF